MIHIKENSVELSISRKMAKQLYLYGVNPKITENKSLKSRLEEIHSRMKMDFDIKDNQIYYS
ncbi:hypothetical protein EW093_13080 [Thiospirochaeta perfilievii]|uniref:Uncharacterized protein n=1 Tax=Thiospirochaeta perfilievii TaxID=252967 RepID=A0A5C1QBZ1_9SPIO|nr:hypothetical protein [Thiospirochaeta perfilievii]QEN05605.1 hypothetical protein EW093_13080 [Thiospirochaeta perfilievii]